MTGVKRRLICIFVIVLALCVDEGLCRGGRGGGGGRGGSRGGSRSRGRGYSGGGSSGYGGGSAAGSTIGIVFGIIGGIVALSVLICVCVMCCQRASGSNKTEGIVYNAPNRTTAGAVNRTSAVSTNFNKAKTDAELNDFPPPYSTIDKPIYNVQNEMETTQLNGSLHNYGYLPQTEVRTSPARSGTKVHNKSSSRKTGSSL